MPRGTWIRWMKRSEDAQFVVTANWWSRAERQRLREGARVGATCYPKCKNGGECLRPGKCRCPPGYGGRYCHKVSCEGGCRNGGECISVNGVVKCLCASGWTGSRCQEAICPQGCRNNGACVAPGICSCPAGWVGGACHLAVCKLPCQHGGKCVAPNVCRCRLPYSGLQCTKKRKE
ncbi:PREDICTED: von Willebrand factor D and EGF domain-containing protein-like [Apaloderma vittatum]|nr:PREDICTED: von Willebrand factor D and EGF domain-containing protein-like [Apaloderma vittatum]